MENTVLRTTWSSLSNEAWLLVTALSATWLQGTPECDLEEAWPWSATAGEKLQHPVPARDRVARITRFHTCRPSPGPAPLPPSLLRANGPDPPPSHTPTSPPGASARGKSRGRAKRSRPRLPGPSYPAGNPPPAASGGPPRHPGPTAPFRSPPASPAPTHLHELVLVKAEVLGAPRQVHLLRLHARPRPAKAQGGGRTHHRHSTAPSASTAPAGTGGAGRGRAWGKRGAAAARRRGSAPWRAPSGPVSANGRGSCGGGRQGSQNGGGRCACGDVRGSTAGLPSLFGASPLVPAALWSQGSWAVLQMWVPGAPRQHPQRLTLTWSRKAAGISCQGCGTSRGDPGLRRWEGGPEDGTVPPPTPPGPEQGHPEPVAQCHVATGFGYCQGWRPRSLSRQAVPGSEQQKKLFLMFTFIAVCAHTWSWVTGIESEHDLPPPSFCFPAGSSVRVLLPSTSFVQGHLWLSEDKFSSKKAPCCHLRFCLPPQDGRQQTISFLTCTFYGFNCVIVSSNEERAQLLTKQL